MNCLNIVDIAFSGKTILWVILIIVNLGFLLMATAKYNPLETFSNLKNNDSIFNMFLKKLEYHAANKRNKMSNDFETQYIGNADGHHSFRQVDDSNVIPSSISDSSSRPRPIPRRHNEDNNNENNDENKNNLNPYNSHGFLGKIMKSFLAINIQKNNHHTNHTHHKHHNHHKHHKHHK